ncbi:hypothetical protein NIES4103_02100 [Nostoc sp. NIES-4103]|nr:hypothetical protein NIES4103_02100 [Nostoc sp. NIES-4103]
MQAEENKAIARRYYDEIMNQGNLATIDELLSPDFLFTIPTHPEPYHGPDGFKQLVTMLRGAFPDVHLSVEHLLADGDTVVGHWTGSGTHAGSPLHTVLGDIPASGKHFSIDGISWLRIVDGKIVESLANEDTLGLLQQIGVLPSESAPVTTTPTENKALVARYFNEIMNQGKLDVIEEVIASNVTVRIPTLHEPFRGYEGVKYFVTGLRAAFPDIKFTVERQIAEKDKVACRFTSISTHQGEFQGILPTGNSIKDQGVDIFRIANGKIAEVWVNENALGLLQQLGAIPSSN